MSNDTDNDCTVLFSTPFRNLAYYHLLNLVFSIFHRFVHKNAFILILI